jgi:hypothetical protein
MLFGKGDRDSGEKCLVNFCWVDGGDESESLLVTERMKDFIRVEEPLFD